MNENQAKIRKVAKIRAIWKDLLREQDGSLKSNSLEILSDLEKFCHASRSTVKVSPGSQSIDPYAMCIAEGRREVWLKICEYLKLDDRDIQMLIQFYNDETYR